MNDTMDLIGGPARAFAAGVKAADENPVGRDALKLCRLIERCEAARALYDKGWGIEARTVLGKAIEEAKR